MEERLTLVRADTSHTASNDSVESCLLSQKLHNLCHVGGVGKGNPRDGHPQGVLPMARCGDEIAVALVW